MRKILFMVLLILSLLLHGCSNTKFLAKPSETNLEYWITQRVGENDFTNCTFLPGGFGISNYLGSKYVALEGAMNSTPKIHVIYSIMGYPDLRDDKAITHIHITDPEVNVYGLTMNSNFEEIHLRMTDLGFKKEQNESGKLFYNKSNVTFSFSGEKIQINAAVTNKSHIVY